MKGWKEIKGPQLEEPDRRTRSFNPKSGATIVGARFPIVAYNVNLKTKISHFGEGDR